MHDFTSKQITLSADNLSIGYSKDNNILAVADGLSFRLEKGKLTCLMGPNGVGKSTLIKTIMRQTPVLKGEIILNGIPIINVPLKELSKKISVVLTDKVSMGNLTAEQLISLGRIPHTAWLGNLSKRDEVIMERAIELTKTDYIRSKRLSELSDGQLQKVMIARALCQDGEVLILDEPTAHLDLVNRYEIMHLLKEIALKEQKAVLVVTHDLDIAIDTADTFWLMQCGFPLESGTPEDLILQGKLNRLLPEGHLVFDAQNGKVQESKIMVFPEIKGDPIAVKWVQNALKKTGQDFSKSNLEIEIKSEPFQILLKEEKNIFYFSSIGELIQHLIQDHKVSLEENSH